MIISGYLLGTHGVPIDDCWQLLTVRVQCLVRGTFNDSQQPSYRPVPPSGGGSASSNLAGAPSEIAV